MNMKFLKNPSISEAKKLKKMPEYIKFAEKLEFYNKLRGGSKYLGVHVDALEAFKGNEGFYTMIHNDLRGHLDGWKESSDAIFLREIERTRGELALDAEKLLSKTEIKDGKSKPMVLLEEANLSYKKTGRRLVVAGAIGMAVTLFLGLLEPYFKGISDLTRTASGMVGVAALMVGSLGSIMAGGFLANGCKDTLETFNKAIGIAKGEPESKEEYKKSSWHYWIR